MPALCPATGGSVNALQPVIVWLVVILPSILSQDIRQIPLTQQSRSERALSSHRTRRSLRVRIQTRFFEHTVAIQDQIACAQHAAVLPVQLFVTSVVVSPAGRNGNGPHSSVRLLTKPGLQRKVR